MARILTDTEIAALLAEVKRLPGSWQNRLNPKPKAGQAHRRRSLRVKGAEGNEFCVHVRDNPNLLSDFSIILTYFDADGQEYTLVRFNGKHPSDHTNKWEKRFKKPPIRFRNAFHIHKATERYQIEPDCQIDGYAEETNLYYSFESALRAFVTSNGFQIEQDLANGQMHLPFCADNGET